MMNQSVPHGARWALRIQRPTVIPAAQYGRVSAWIANEVPATRGENGFEFLSGLWTLSEDVGDFAVDFQVCQRFGR